MRRIFRLGLSGWYHHSESGVFIGMPIIKHKVRHRVGTREFLKHRLRAFISTIRNVGIEKVSSDISHSFIFGCGHSGTTLLSSRLGLAQDVMLIDKETSAYLPGRRLAATRRQVIAWQHEAASLGCSVILEKTPKHVHGWTQISRLHPDARFIGIVRNPLDNVASLYKRFHDLDLSCERYVIDNGALWTLARERRGIVLNYEDLTERPKETLSKALQWLGCPWDDAILGESTLYKATEHSKANQRRRFAQVAQPISPNSGGYKKVLSPSQIEQVLKATSQTAQLFGYSFPSHEERLQ